MHRLTAAFLWLALVAGACGADTAPTTGSGSSAPDDGLPAGPSALADPDAPGLPTPLVDTNRIISGGPPPDGIPPIDEPQFTPADQVDFLDDVEPVLVVEVGDETRIYPVQILIWHELVNDTIDGVPVSVSYCPLCNSAITYDRRVDRGVGAGPAVLDFGTSGKLYNSALVMYDRQTESLWSHFTGQAVAGVLTGTTLDTHPTATVGWAAARAAHPDAAVLNRDTGFPKAYGQNPYAGYDDVTTSPFAFDGDADGRLLAMTRVIGIRDVGEAYAVQTDEIGLPGIVDLRLRSRSITVWRVPGAASALDTADIAYGREVGSTGVFDRRLDGRELRFRIEDRADGQAIVDEGGSTWDILGRAVDGPLAGRSLTPIDHVDTFWFAWAAFLPETTVVPPPAG